jgi:hypothetical protein
MMFLETLKILSLLLLPLLQDFEAGSTDPLDRMTTKQVVKILTESFLNSEFHDNALAHVLEINQIVSAQNIIKLLDLNCSGFLQPKLYRFATDLELCSRCGIRLYSLGVNCLMCIMLSLKSH